MDQASIDIRYIELLVWLEGRYLIPKDWAKRLELIQNKKNELLDEFFNKNTAEMKKLQDTFKIFKNNYEPFTFNDLMRLNTMLLKTEEAKSKTLFGAFNSSFINNSNLLVGIYNKNNMHIAESSKIIMQYINYDIPNYEKSIQYNNKTINEYSSKINEKSTQITNNLQKIKNLFKKYEIKETEKGNEIALALAERLCSLERSLSNIDTLLTSNNVANAIKIYQDFYKKIYHQEIEKLDENFLKTLKRMNKEGDYVEGNGDNKNKYMCIKNKIEQYKQKYESIDIQADIEAQIWNFKLVGGETENYNSENQTGLLNLNTRKQLINDLNEVLIFLNHRISQFNNKNEINLGIYQNNLREINMEITPDKLKECQTTVSNILNILYNSDLQFLFNLYDDEKNMKIILNKFELIRLENKKFSNSNNDMEAKIVELNKENSEIDKKITQLKKDVKLVKKQMEKYLTDLIKRKVTIMGDINLI